MGPAYGEGRTVLGILAAGYLMLMIQRPARNILAGMNAHGRPAVVSLLAGICAVVLASLALGPLQWGLVGAAIPVAICLTAAYGLYLPIYVTRRLELPLGQYLFKSMRGPLLCTAPYAFCLLGIRILVPEAPAFALLCAAIAALLTLTPLYWRNAIPKSIKSKLTERVLLKLSARVKASA
ncbi:MAG: hypothetical protein ACYSTL_05685 [Planctomycetota bacterium]|jgi:O-antigen/teichoic acid export membrane protein